MKPCQIISWSKIQNLARLLAQKLRTDNFIPDTIIAIGRGGYMPARYLSDYLGIFDLTSFKIEHYHGTRKHSKALIKYPLTADVSNKRILIVDDVSDSGDTFEIAIQHILEHGTPLVLKTAVLHHKLTSVFVPDYYGQKIVKWRWLIYPWAVTEDLSTMIASEMSIDMPIPEIAAQLKTKHGISVSPQHIQDALTLLQE